jgi:4-oxalocrotonate tautomerase
MPLVRIDRHRGKAPAYRRKIGDMVYHAMLETINMPEHDRFQVITDHPAEGLLYDPSYPASIVPTTLCSSKSR